MKSFSCAFALASNLFAAAQDTPPVLSVNGEQVSSAEYLRRMEYLPGLGKQNFKGEFVEVLPGIATIDALITEKLILQAAKSKSLTPTDAEVDAEIKFRLKKNPNTLIFWKATGRTEAEYRRVVLVEVAQFKLQTAGIVVTDADIKSLYDLSKEARYTIPVRYKIRVISVRNDEDTVKVDTGLKEGKSFAALAALYSSDGSSKEGGLFGTVPVDVLSDIVKLEILKLKPKEMTGWISGGEGVKAKFLVEEIVPQTLIPLNDEIKEDIRRELALRRGSTKNDVSKMIKELRSKSEIKITNPEFEQAYRQMVDLAKKVGG